MRKFLIVLLAAVLLIGVASAEDIFAKPLEEMSLEELTAANLKIGNEITARFGKIDGYVLEPGIYVAGEDFPAGSYYFEGGKGKYPANIYEYPSIEKTSGLGAIQEIHNVGEDIEKTGRFIFQDGNVLKIVTGSAVIHIYKGLMD